MKRTAVIPTITTVPRRPTAESIAAEINASPDPRGLRLRVLAVLDELDRPAPKPLSAATIMVLPIETLLARTGITLAEMTAAETAASSHEKTFGILVRQTNEQLVIATPAGMDVAERDRIIRQLIWQNVNNPVTADKPIHLVQGDR